jgi:hypothetical protein
LHAVGPQTYGSQAVGVAGAQLPAPSQYRTGVDDPALQEAAAQIVALFGNAPHLVLSAPSQVA